MRGLVLIGALAAGCAASRGDPQQQAGPLGVCRGDDQLVTTAIDLSTLVPGDGLSATMDGAELVVRGTTVAPFADLGTPPITVPEGQLLRGVSLCYTDATAQVFVRYVRLTQREAPDREAVLQDDPTQLDPPAGCTDPLARARQSGSCQYMDPVEGDLRTYLAVSVGDLSDGLRIQSLSATFSPP